MMPKLRAALLALAFALSALAGSAAAQPATPEQKGTRIAHLLLVKVDFGAIVAAQVKQNANAFNFNPERPEWGKLMADAVTEEVEHSRPLLEQIIGSRIARELSPEELDAGLVISADPSIQQGVAASAEGEKETGQIKPSREAERAARSRAGMGFLTKLVKLEAMLQGAQGDYMAALMPGLLRRVADKIEAAEKARVAW